MPNDFWEMTFVDYVRYIIYCAKKDANEWDKTRVLMSYILNTQVEKKHQRNQKILFHYGLISIGYFKKSQLSYQLKKKKKNYAKDKLKKL